MGVCPSRQIPLESRVVPGPRVIRVHRAWVARRRFVWAVRKIIHLLTIRRVWSVAYFSSNPGARRVGVELRGLVNRHVDLFRHTYRRGGRLIHTRAGFVGYPGRIQDGELRSLLESRRRR